MNAGRMCGRYQLSFHCETYFRQIWVCVKMGFKRQGGPDRFLWLSSLCLYMCVYSGVWSNCFFVPKHPHPLTGGALRKTLSVIQYHDGLNHLFPSSVRWFSCIMVSNRCDERTHSLLWHEKFFSIRCENVDKLQNLQ